MTILNPDKPRGLVLAALLTITAICDGSASPEVRLYTTDTDTQQLFVVSTTDASTTLVGDFGVTGLMADLAYDALDQILLGTTTGTNNLYSIDRTTGAATLIGPLGVNLMHGLAFDNLNRIVYGATSNNSALYQINLTSGKATLIGSIGNFFPDPRDGIAGLAFNPADNVLYGCIAGPSKLGGLVSIDTSTGVGTFLRSTTPLTDIAFHPESGALYGCYNGAGVTPDALYSIDFSTGNTSLIGQTGLGNSLGLEFAPLPEPSIMAQVIFILLSMMLTRRRHRTSN